MRPADAAPLGDLSELLSLAPQCEARVCPEPASHALVFQTGCGCQSRHAWLLCLPHVERGLRELRERFGWRCGDCGLAGFWCTPVRVDPLAAR